MGSQWTHWVSCVSKEDKIFMCRLSLGFGRRVSRKMLSTEFFVSETVDDVVVHHSRGLHVCVANR